eukprot:4528258-Prymnesium_polylepis.1
MPLLARGPRLPIICAIRSCIPSNICRKSSSGSTCPAGRSTPCLPNRSYDARAFGSDSTSYASDTNLKHRSASSRLSGFLS